MTVERLAVAVLLCAGLNATGTGAREPVRPLPVAVPPLGNLSDSSGREAATSGAPGPDAAREPLPAPETAGESALPPPEEEYIPLDLPPEEGGDPVGADPAGADSSGAAGAQASAVEPVVLGLDEEPPAATYFVYAEILGVPNSEGMVSASLCLRENFTKSGCRTERVAARQGQVSVVFGDVAPGRYAVQVHHDENGNGKMDFTFFGLPKEPYGFSRDAKPVLAPPKFRKASFEVTDSDVSLVINLQNT